MKNLKKKIKIEFVVILMCPVAILCYSITKKAISMNNVCISMGSNTQWPDR